MKFIDLVSLFSLVELFKKLNVIVHKKKRSLVLFESSFNQTVCYSIFFRILVVLGV